MYTNIQYDEHGRLLKEKPLPMTEEELNQLYDILNRRRFGGELPKVKVRWARKTLKSRYIGRYYIKYKGILLSQWYHRRYPREVIATLLHEMVHVWQRHVGMKDIHGASFKRKAKEIGAMRRPSY